MSESKLSVYVRLNQHLFVLVLMGIWIISHLCCYDLGCYEDSYYAHLWDNVQVSLQYVPTVECWVVERVCVSLSSHH